MSVDNGYQMQQFMLSEVYRGACGDCDWTTPESTDPFTTEERLIDHAADAHGRMLTSDEI